MKQTMKRVLAVLLAALLLVASAPAAGFTRIADFLSVTAAAETVSGACGAQGDNVTWSLNTDTGVLTISGTGEMADYLYSSLAPWYLYSPSIKTVTIVDSVTDIGDHAFSDCTRLTSVTIGNSVTVIGANAFEYCENLTSVTIPDSVTTIDGFAFLWCTSLTDVTIPKSVTRIGGNAFSGCTGFTAITVDEHNPAYSSDGYGVMYNKDKTELLQYPCGNPRASFTIPDSVATVGAGAFSDCENLTSVTIPDSVTAIGANAFEDCRNLTSVTIPASVTDIGDDAFYGVGNIVYSGEADGSPWGARNRNKYAEGDFVFDSDRKTTLLWCSRAAAGTVTIPDSVTAIGDEAFAYCRRLASVTIPDSVTTIGNSAFYCCNSLVSVTIPASVTDIGYDAFYGVGNIVYSGEADGSPWGARNLNKYAEGDFVFDSDRKTTLLWCRGDVDAAVIPAGVTAIGESAFEDCENLTSVTIPDSVTTIGEGAWDCLSLMTITVDEQNPAYSSDGYGILYNKDKTELIQYPIGDPRASFTIPDSVATVGAGAFMGCANLTSVTIPDSVTTIGFGAFLDCVYLASVTIGNSVITIGTYAFFYCADLTSVTIPDSVTTIGEAAFGDCYTLADLTIGNSVTAIGARNFIGCENLTSVTIPDSVTTIGASAFAYCTSLESLHIPSSVTEIGENAFNNCGSLEYICSDTADCCAKTYAEANGIEFRVCGGHGEPARVAGDANGDGVLDLKDVVVIRRYLAGGWGVTISESAADVDADNAVTLQDVVLLRRYLVGGWDVTLK